MSRRPWLGLALSLALHAGVIALVLTVVTRDEMLPALMVDLRDAFVPGVASVKFPAREERPAPREPQRRARKGKSAAATAAPAVPSPPPVSADPPSPPPIVEAPVPPPAAPAISAPPAISALPAISAPSAPVTEPPRDASAASPPSREPVPAVAAPRQDAGEARPPGLPAGAPTPTAPARGGGAAGVSGATSGAGGTTSGGSQQEGGGAGQRVAVVPPGVGGSRVGAEYGPYLAALRQRIQQSVRYPPNARRRGLAGTVSVEILILPNGSIADVTLLESSSHAVLDDAALDTIRSLPRVPLPPELPARPLRVRVPVVFQMR